MCVKGECVVEGDRDYEGIVKRCKTRKMIWFGYGKMKR